MGEISFYRYAAIVKNLRGVLYLKDKEGLKRIASRFRYRCLGVPPYLSRDVPEKSNLVPLAFPSNDIIKVKDLFSKVLDERISETMCLASAYLSSIITDCIHEFKDLLIVEVKSSKELTDKDWKLHARIADYTVLDLYCWSYK